MTSYETFNNNEDDSQSKKDDDIPKFGFTDDSWILSERAKMKDSMGEARALANLVKSLIGTGILSLPMAFYHAGLWTGLFLTCFICLLNLYCMHLLVDCAHYCGKRYGLSQVDYATLSKLAFEMDDSKYWLKKMGPFMMFITNALIMVNQFGFCCVYIVFMAENIRQVSHAEFPNFSMYLWEWVLVLLPFVLALAMIRHLKWLAPVAMIANVLYLFGFIITFQYLFHSLPEISSRPVFNSLKTLPLFFGTVMFSFEGICVVLPIENRMQNPIRFVAWNGVLNVGCLMVIALYMGVGFFGYLRFGEDIKDSLTLNLPHIWIYQSVKIMVSVAILVTYALQFYVPMEIIEKMYRDKIVGRARNVLIYGVRIFLVLITFALAELIPYLNLFISLIGSLAGAGLALILPPLIHTLCLFHKDKGQYSQRYKIYVTSRNVLIAFIGVVGFAAGSYSSITAIVAKFERK